MLTSLCDMFPQKGQINQNTKTARKDENSCQ